MPAPWEQDEIAFAAPPWAQDEIVGARPPLQAMPSHTPAAAGPPPDAAEAGMRGALQGASAGWSDEAAAAIDAALPWLSRHLTPEVLAGAPGDTSFRQRYEAARDFYRARNAAAEDAHRGFYVGGQLAGAAVPAARIAKAVGAVGNAARAAGLAAAEGAANGAGYSEADDAAGLGRDAAIGTGLGLAGHGVSTAAGQGLSVLRRAMAARAANAVSKAEQQAAREVADEIASATGAYGSAVQRGSRSAENVRRLADAMTPEQAAAYEQLQAVGVVPALEQQVAGGTLGRIPGQAAEITRAEALVRALRDGAERKTAARTAELLTPQAGKDARSFSKSYLEGPAAAFLAYEAADALGATPEQKAIATGAAGLVFSRTRAGKALAARLTRPAHQKALAEWIAEAAAGPTSRGVQATLARGAPAVATDALTTQRARTDEETEALIRVLGGG